MVNNLNNNIVVWDEVMHFPKILSGIDKAAYQMNALTDKNLWPIIKLIYFEHPSTYSKMMVKLKLKYSTLHKRVSKLSSSGLVAKVEGYYVLTKRGYQLYKDIEKYHSGISKSYTD